MTPPRTYPYAIYYNDGSYMVYDLTKADFDRIKSHLSVIGEPIKFIDLSIGILGLSDIRSIIEQREPEVAEELLDADPILPLDVQGYLNSLRGSERD